MIDYTPRTIINGSLLRNFISQNVSLLVNVEEEADRQSKLIKGKTTDDVDVKIVLGEPLNVPVKGWIEVIGIPQGPDTIRNKEVRIYRMQTISLNCSINSIRILFVCRLSFFRKTELNHSIKMHTIILLYF